MPDRNDTIKPEPGKDFLPDGHRPSADADDLSADQLVQRQFASGRRSASA